MQNMFEQDVVTVIVNMTKLKKEDVEKLIELPPKQEMGDFAFPCFILSKKHKKAPNQIAQELAAEIMAEGKHKGKKPKLPATIAEARALGPYVNFFLDKTLFMTTALKGLFMAGKKLGESEIGKGKTIVLDYSAPNIAKPFGIGHLRSTVIGNALYKVYKSQGFKTVGINHLGDWGTQFGKVIYAYKKWGSKEKLEKNPIKHLLELYVDFHEKAEKDDKLNDYAREWFKKLEDGNKEAVRLWTLFRKLSIVEFKRVYELLNVKFDSYDGEAFYNDKMDRMVAKIKMKKLTEISDDATIVNLEAFNMAPLILLKRDGASTYATRDLTAVDYRLTKYKPDKILYVVGGEQRLHFQQVFKVLELAGYDPGKLEHIPFGLIKLGGMKMSTRKGSIIMLEDVLNKSIKMAVEIIKEKNPKLKNKKKVAEWIGVGAIIFADLSNDRVRNIEFNWSKMLDFEGETSPYLQYTNARANSILKKAGKKITSVVDYSLLKTDEEYKLVVILARFNSVLLDVLHDNKPHHLCRYLLDLAQAFNLFYHKCPVIIEDEKLMKARLLLVDSVRQVLEKGLGLLGIEAPDEM